VTDEPRQAFFTRYVHPLVVALHTHDPAVYAKARQALAEQRDAAASPDIARAIEFVLAYYTYTSTLVLDLGSQQQEALQQALRGFAPPAMGEISSLVRRRYLLQLKLLAYQAEQLALSRAEFDELVAALPPADRHTEQWVFISEYYFQQQDLPHVIEAYEQYLEASSRWAKDYNWRRLNVMMKLLDGTAIRQDAELLINSMIVPACERELRRSFWPQFRRYGFADEELEALLLKRLERLRQHYEAAE
jgi:hypothetical protein